MSAIDKIKKLLAMAGDPGASEQERETAGRQASALMVKHEVDEYDLMVANGSDWDLIEVRVNGMRPGKKAGSEVPPWIGIIAQGVKLFTQTRAIKSRNQIIYRGPRAQVELASWMLETIVKECYQASRNNPQPGAWRNGYAAAVQRRLAALGTARGSEHTSGGTGTSLIVIRDRMSAAMDEMWGAEGKSKKASCSESELGRMAGDNAHLPTNRPMQDSGVKGYLS